MKRNGMRSACPRTSETDKKALFSWLLTLEKCECAVVYYYFESQSNEKMGFPC